MPSGTTASRLRLRAVALAAAVAVGVSACGAFAATPSPTPALFAGPLCQALPQGDDPGGPVLLREMPAHEALTWIPVGTVFEAGSRHAELVETLDTAEGLTIFVPSDDAFYETMAEESIDELFLFRQDELGPLLEQHVIEGQYSVAELIEAGELETLAGDTRTFVAAADGMARIDDNAETICADYQVGNARIHVIDELLGELPPHEPGGEDEH
jgi:hypothetical protein